MKRNKKYNIKIGWDTKWPFMLHGHSLIRKFCPVIPRYTIDWEMPSGYMPLLPGKLVSIGNSATKARYRVTGKEVLSPYHGNPIGIVRTNDFHIFHRRLGAVSVTLMAKKHPRYLIDRRFYQHVLTNIFKNIQYIKNTFNVKLRYRHYNVIWKWTSGVSHGAAIKNLIYLDNNYKKMYLAFSKNDRRQMEELMFLVSQHELLHTVGVTLGDSMIVEGLTEYLSFKLAQKYMSSALVKKKYIKKFENIFFQRRPRADQAVYNVFNFRPVLDRLTTGKLLIILRKYLRLIREKGAYWDGHSYRYFFKCASIVAGEDLWSYAKQIHRHRFKPEYVLTRAIWKKSRLRYVVEYTVANRGAGRIPIDIRLKTGRGFITKWITVGGGKSYSGSFFTARKPLALTVNPQKIHPELNYKNNRKRL